MNYLLALMVVGNFSIAPATQLPLFSTLRACQAQGAAWVKATEQTIIEGRANYACVPVERGRAKSKRKGSTAHASSPTLTTP